MRYSRLRLGVFALLFALFFAMVGAGITLAAQPHMVNARNYLNSALSELQAATSDKGGHRVNAINYVKNAINEVNLGIQYAR
jgi:lipopolysaccharide export LptBFGC system permease protein LptF